MSRAAVICEFNPFHNGHKFLLEKIKAENADEIVCIMSGNFVQRGDIAITDKYTRAKAALQNGADIVVELPTVYAVSPAPIFARSGVQLAYELNCDTLCFGAESNLSDLEETLDALDRNDTQEEIAARMQSGTYYPRAVSEALGKNYSETISQPNNILAIEYIRACREFGLQPVAIPRKGAAHDSELTVGTIASASKIRSLILSGENYSAYTPMTVKTVYTFENNDRIPVFLLKTMKPEETEKIAGVTEGINNRLYKCAQQYNTLDEILSAAKTKRYTMARLRRIALSVCLNITQELQDRPVPYVRVLGIKQEKSHLIKSRTLPLLVDVKRGYEQLDQAAKEVFDVDIRATDLMNCRQTPDYPLNEFQYGIIKV